MSTIQKKIKTAKHFLPSEDLVKVLMQKTRNPNALFFRTIVGFYYSMIASSMRAKVVTLDRGEIPVNLYCINMLTSGGGKGFSTGIMNNQVISGFRSKFTEDVMPNKAELELERLAVKRADMQCEDPELVKESIKEEYKKLGEFEFVFDNGSAAALKQARHKLLMSKVGALSMVTDEIGSHLSHLGEILNVFLELYDMGMVNPKIIKNTAESIRNKPIVGKTPANMLLFGTPSKLLDGGKVEELFNEFLETGFARRTLICYISPEDSSNNRIKSPEDLFDIMTDTSTNKVITESHESLKNLADPIFIDSSITVSKTVTLLYMEYQIWCEERADKIPTQDSVSKAEMTHRYFKAIKLAGAYAFVSQSPVITEELLLAAIKVTEECGVSFKQLMRRERPFERLAKYICEVPYEVTHADLVQQLPYYTGTESAKRDMLVLAIAHGFRNNMLIRKRTVDGIDLFTGDRLEETNLDELIIAGSTNITDSYTSWLVPFSRIDTLTQQPNLHWVNHHLNGKVGFAGGYRDEESVVPGFNTIVLDVDGGVDINVAMKTLENYTYHVYTTKRHDPKGDHRFRVILPLSHKLVLSGEDYKHFMQNIEKWLAFPLDEQTHQRSRKWLSNVGDHYSNEGVLVPALEFCPYTKACDERSKAIADLGNLDGIERWFILNTSGGRNNALLRYAMLLVDSGLSQAAIETKVTELNNKLSDPISESELLSTVFVTVAKKANP